MHLIIIFYKYVCYTGAECNMSGFGNLRPMGHLRPKFFCRRVPKGYRPHLLTDSIKKGADTSVRSSIWSSVDVVVTVLSSRNIYWIVYKILSNLYLPYWKRKTVRFLFHIWLVLFLLTSSSDWKFYSVYSFCRFTKQFFNVTYICPNLLVDSYFIKEVK